MQKIENTCFECGQTVMCRIKEEVYMCSLCEDGLEEHHEELAKFKVINKEYVIKQ